MRNPIAIRAWFQRERVAWCLLHIKHSVAICLINYNIPVFEPQTNLDHKHTYTHTNNYQWWGSASSLNYISTEGVIYYVLLNVSPGEAMLFLKVEIIINNIRGEMTRIKGIGSQQWAMICWAPPHRAMEMSYTLFANIHTHTHTSARSAAVVWWS